jgi:CO/xanthine dehydrogenase Mo-binding subunit/aerobic-type carbon monoxide dehydrogenase small subunit (CoxS/CutS family)
VRLQNIAATLQASCWKRLLPKPGREPNEKAIIVNHGKTLSLMVNGSPVSLPLISGETLAQLLRERLGLTGTKIGCNEAECGTCTVLVNGEPIFSCSYPAVRAQGKEVTTIEGLAALLTSKAKNQGLHPLQEAFINFGAVQCGFCTPGQIMTAYALLKRNPNPTRGEIRVALSGAFCRCGCYPAIERAILSVSDPIHSALAMSPATFSIEDHRGVGSVQIRPDALEKVTGKAKYTDDLIFDDMLYGRVKRAEVPHAILLQLDVSKARELPGVHAVLTAEDLPGEHNHGLVSSDWPILVGIGERIRYVGDAIAIVAADTSEIATKALELITLDFDLQPVVKDPLEAHQPDAPILHENGNLLKHIRVRKGDVEHGFNQADLVLEHTFQTPIAEQLFMEPECSIACPTPDGQMEIYVGSQIPYSDREQVARALGWSERRVRVIGQFVGGAFGGKEDIAGQIHAALLAQVSGRPVKLLFDRHESMLVHPKRHSTQIRVKVGAKKDGSLTAVETELYGDTGAYASLGEKVMERATTHSAGPYEIPNVRADCYAMYTNNPPAGAFRGFGVTQSTFAIESMMDILSKELGMDPVELRRKNALREGGTTSTGQVLRESVGLLDCMDKVEAEMKKRAGEHPFAPRTEGFIRKAWGFAAAYKNTGFGVGAKDSASAEIELLADGTLEARTSSAEVGQGLSTVLQMIVAEEFEVPSTLVHVHLMDTELTPDGGATTASRQTYVSGNAVRLAARTLRQAIVGVLAEKYDLSPNRIHFLGDQVEAGNHRIPLASIVGIMKAEGNEACVRYEYQAPATKPLGEGGDIHFAYSFAAQAAEVSVDTRTGEVAVLQVITANDVGKCLNPLGLQGQAEGGVMMGIGEALMENFIVDDGMVFTDKLARYRIPSFLQTPEIVSFVIEHPTEDGPYGAKGVGEIAGVPTAPAIINAIYNAVGVRVDRLPVDHELIWRSQEKS